MFWCRTILEREFDSWWCYQMETFSVLLVFCEGNLTLTLWGESTSHRLIPLTKDNDGELCYFLWCASDWANSPDASNLRHGAHCDVTVTSSLSHTTNECSKASAGTVVTELYTLPQSFCCQQSPRVTLRNFFARFSAKRNIDRKN